MTRLEAIKSTYGNWALVTGASDGIGREFALILAQSGVNLVLVARRREVLESLSSALEKDFSIQTMVLPADLTHTSAVQDVINATRYVDIGLLIAAAGFGTSGRFIENRRDDELAMIDLNCRAVVDLCHHFTKRFQKRGRGGIVLMSSLLAFQGVHKAATYAATKAFIQTFAEGLRLEMKAFGVDVIASAPGPIHSGFGKRADMKMSMGQKPSVVAKATLLALGKRTTVRPGWLSLLLEWSLSPLPRWGRVRILSIIMSGMTKHQHPDT